MTAEHALAMLDELIDVPVIECVEDQEFVDEAKKARAFFAAMVEREKAATKPSCEGCQHLCTEHWRDCLDNDETDSGTLAKCMHSIPAKTINVYWNKGQAVPTWCPLANPEPQP